VGLALALGFFALRAVPAAGQQPTPSQSIPCPSGRVSSVTVDNQSIFDLGQLEGGGILRPVYRLANALHVKTKEGFIRGELLLAEGDCYDPSLVEESGRILRGYGFFTRADVEVAGEEPDGSKRLRVDTKDEWTTSVSLGVSFERGLALESLGLTEHNVAGRGILAQVFFRRRMEREDVGGRIELPRLFSTRTDLAVTAGSTRAGTFFEEVLAYPFVGEVGRWAVRQAYRRRDEIFPYGVGAAGVDYSHVLLPFLDERIEVLVAGRIGRPGNLTLLGMGVARELLNFEDFPQRLEIARDADFGSASPAPAGVDDLVRAQTKASSTTRLDLFVGQRNIRFARVRGLDPLDGIQDIRLGTDFGLTLGRSIDVLTASGFDAVDDLYARVRVFAGQDPGTSFVFLNAGLEGRRVLSGAQAVDAWRDVLGEADVYAYVRAGRLPGHTFFARASGAGGWSFDTPFQLTLGGRAGVRGFNEEDFPAARRVLFTLEDRIFYRWPAPELLDLGFTLFADAGRVWPGDVPFGTDSGWKGSVGLGLRFGFPPASRGVARIDLAFPLGGEPGRSPVLRVTLHELLGLRAGFEDPQLGRSRRISSGPDFFTTERR
jgi:hypothetical protein